MAQKRVPKKRLVTSFNNLSSELQESVKLAFPLGFSEAMMRIDKPNGDFFYAVSFETEEIDYLVKIDVKVDEKSGDDDKDLFGDNLKGADDMTIEGADDEEDDDEPRRRRRVEDEYDDDDDM